MPPQRAAAPAAAQTQTQAQTQAARPQPPSDFERLLAKDHRLEYEPFGGKGNIRLSVSIVQNLICVKTKSGKGCSENDALKFMAMCQAKRMNPFEGDCYLIGYDGKNGPEFSMITAHQTYLKRAELHPEYDGMKSGLIVHEDNEDGTYTTKEIEGDFYESDQIVVGGWAEVHFKNRKVPTKKRLRLERFKKPFGVWVDDAAGMICKCAEADALRSSFPTMLGGLYMREEMELQVNAPVKPDFGPTDMLKGNPPQMFNPTPTENGNAQPGQAAQPAAAPASVPAPAPAPAAEPTPIDKLRQLQQKTGIDDNRMLNYLVGIGASDTATSLEEVALSSPEIIPMVIEHWADVSANILSQGKAK